MSKKLFRVKSFQHQLTRASGLSRAYFFPSSFSLYLRKLKCHKLSSSLQIVPVLARVLKSSIPYAFSDDIPLATFTSLAFFFIELKGATYTLKGSFCCMWCEIVLSQLCTLILLQCCPLCLWGERLFDVHKPLIQTNYSWAYIIVHFSRMKAWL